MNPSSNETPGLNLPTPVNEQVPNMGSGAGEAQGSGQEFAPVAEKSSQAEAASGVAAAYTVPLPTDTPVQQVSDDSLTTSSVAQTATTDSDLIDKSIVDKAKAIIERTKDDPYTQTEELTVFRAEHLSKNYNRKIKTKS